jgi:hypothetical protein
MVFNNLLPVVAPAADLWPNCGPPANQREQLKQRKGGLMPRRRLIIRHSDLVHSARHNLRQFTLASPCLGGGECFAG